MEGNVRPTENMFTRSHRLPTNYVSAVEDAIKNFGSLDSVETGSSTCTGDSDSYRMAVERAMEDFQDSLPVTEMHTGKTTSASSSDWDVACEYEFELVEADRVRLMFAAMFSLLFERRASEGSPAHLAAECHDWVSCFPHLRLLGNQLLAPQDKGYDFFPTVDRQPDSGLESESDSSEGISLTGRKLEPNTPPSTARSATSTNSQASSLGAKDDILLEEEVGEAEEEIIACDGVYEDMIAVDYRLGEDDTSEQLKRYVRQRRLGMPPMTPSNAIRDAILNTIFDILWADTVAMTRPLVYRMLHGPKKETDVELPQISPHDLGVLSSSQRDSFPRLPRSSAPQDSKTLTGLLHITSKTLQFRERSYLQDIPESPPMERRTVADQRPPPAAHRPAADSRVPSAARRRGRLAPLDRTRASNVDEEGFGLRGHRLQTPGNAADALTRSGTLPPLSMSLLVKPGSSQRINSAAASRNVPSTPQRPLHHSLGAGLSSELRPSTTHTFHASSLGLKPLGLLSLGIHGSSIGTSQNTGTAGVEEEEEKRTRVPWGPVYPASLYPVHHILRRGKPPAPVHNSTVR